jgi:hypothetical protein
VLLQKICFFIIPLLLTIILERKNRKQPQVQPTLQAKRGEKLELKSKSAAKTSPSKHHALSLAKTKLAEKDGRSTGHKND